jgi:Cof subfamily protein (haloacid dehalogenase superfamily)
MKIIFLDIDGTLIDYQHNLPGSARTAVQAARRRGHRVYLATGRCKAEIYDEILSIGFDGMICANGTYIESGGTVVQNLTIEASLAARALSWLTAKSCGYYYQSTEGLFADELFRASFSRSDVSLIRSDHLYPVQKINFILHPGILDEASRLFGSVLQIASWSGSGTIPEFGEFSPPATNKALAVASLIGMLGIDRSDTISFGDAESDIAMIEYCNTGVAMGNALPVVKAHADFTTGSVMDDGILKAFRHLDIIPADLC